MVTWEQLETYCSNCHRCKLHSGRTNVVIGDGNKNADIMFIGEGPGQQEDLQGLPFVGPAGQLFNKMLHSIGLDRQKVYICNVVKCRPPYNRDPEDDEKAACLPLLRAQVSLVKPKIIVCLGRIAGNVVLHPNFRITKEHGIWEERKSYWLSATYHPSALLRDQSKKRDAWEDLKKLRAKIEELGIFADPNAAETQPAAKAAEITETVEENQAEPPTASAEKTNTTAENTTQELQKNTADTMNFIPPTETADTDFDNAAATSDDLPWEAAENSDNAEPTTDFDDDDNSEITDIWEETAAMPEEEENNPFDDIDFSPNAELSVSRRAYSNSVNSDQYSDDDLDLLVF